MITLALIMFWRYYFWDYTSSIYTWYLLSLHLWLDFGVVLVNKYYGIEEEEEQEEQGRFCFERQWVCTGIDCPGLTQCYNLDFTVLFVRETTLHLAFLSGLQSFKKLFLFQEKKKMWL